MPIYEYYCKQCNYAGEHLVPSYSTQISCPNDKEHGILEKKVSGFSIGGSHISPPSENLQIPFDKIKEGISKVSGIPTTEIELNHVTDVKLPCVCGENIDGHLVRAKIRDPQRN